MELMIGDKLKKLRRNRDLTQEEVAAHIGISYQAISKWERGDGYPDITMLPTLANYFGVSVDYLLGNETDFKSQTESVISDDDIKFALWGDVADEIPNDKLQEVKTFAEFIKNTYKKDNNK